MLAKLKFSPNAFASSCATSLLPAPRTKFGVVPETRPRDTYSGLSTRSARTLMVLEIPV